MRDILLAATDRAELAQLVVVLVAMPTVMILVRHERTLVLLSVGYLLAHVGLTGVRTLHRPVRHRPSSGYSSSAGQRGP